MHSWKYWARAFQWVPTWLSEGLDGFQKYFRHCVLDVSSIIIGWVNAQSSQTQPHNVDESWQAKALLGKYLREKC